MRNMRVPRGASHIVDHTQFTDARPTLGSPSTTFNPASAAQAGPLPKGPPKYVGGTRRIAQGETNKRFQYN